MPTSKNVLLALSAAFTMLLPVIAPAAFADTVPGTVQIIATCGLNITPTSLNYGSLAQGATSTEQILNIQNTGTSSGTLRVSGTNWTDASSNTLMPSTQTRFDNPPGFYAYSSKTNAVSTTPTVVASLGPGSTVHEAFQLQVSLSNPAFTGTLSQTLTLSTSC